MEIKQLLTFYTVAKTGSFSEAGNVLNYAQPTITSHIQSLEQELDIPLFDRLGKSIQITAAGEKLLTYAEQMIRMAGEAKSVVTGSSNDPAGDFHLIASGSILSYYLVPILQQFLDSYPDVNLKLIPSLHVDIVSSIIEGKADIGLAYRQELPDSVDYIKLADANILLACSVNHPLAANPDIDALQLCDYELILMSGLCPLRELIERSLSETGMQVSPYLEFHNYDDIKQFTHNSMGIAFFPEVVIRAEIDRGELIPVSWQNEPIQMPIWLLWHRDKWMSPAVIAFRDLVLEKMGARLRPVSA